MYEIERWLKDTSLELNRKIQGGFPSDVDAELVWNKVKAMFSFVLSCFYVYFNNCVVFIEMFCRNLKILIFGMIVIDRILSIN